MRRPSLLLAAIVFSLATLQSTSPSVAQTPDPAARSAPTVHLMTVIDNPDLLGGQRVRIPDVAIRQILNPRLVIVSEPRVLGIIDWEISTLGDPLAELSYLCMLWRTPMDCEQTCPRISTCRAVLMLIMR